MDDIAMDMGVDVDDVVDIDVDHNHGHHDEQPGIDDILHSLGHSRATISAGSGVPVQDDNLAHPDAADADNAASTSRGEPDASLPVTGPSVEDTSAESDAHAAADVQEIAGWSVPQLHAEIIRLRREVRRLNPAWFLPTLGVGEADTAAALGAALGASLQHNLGDMSRSSGSVLGVARDASGDRKDDGVTVGPGERAGSEAVKKRKGAAAKRGDGRAGGGGGGRKKRKREEKEVVLDTETGKRVEKARRTELGKAVRAKVGAAGSGRVRVPHQPNQVIKSIAYPPCLAGNRSSHAGSDRACLRRIVADTEEQMRDVMGIRETDPLPTYSPLEVTYDVPNWSAGLDSMGQAVSAPAGGLGSGTRYLGLSGLSLRRAAGDLSLGLSGGPDDQA
ncbi:hypothetical protein EHS25_009906 [Saitozyma podzolica]|uniref:Uncharacterized protein n=1 Tax=Saitozyma podzolica TaxID=1890683 RepID=A0A427YI23_9TREE|nr:hypothetical protein EHS25_009906 [Saitozyma podzolica]